MTLQSDNTFYPQTPQHFREWLGTYHIEKDSIWVIFYKTKSGIPSITWSEAVDQAICFGWIDSVKKSVGKDQYIQYFSKRKPNSVWSKINKDKVTKLTEDGLMMPAGRKAVEIAKQNGTWNLLDDAENLVIPTDLQLAFDANPGSREYFMSLSKSVIKGHLQRLAIAKMPSTKQKRINEIIGLKNR